MSRSSLAVVALFALGGCSAARHAASDSAHLSRRSRAPRAPEARLQWQAATPTSDSAYLALRRSYQRSLAARETAGDSTVDRADSIALRDLEPRLRPLIGPVSVAGFADSGRINLATLLGGYEDSSLPDGLVFESPQARTRMFVTTSSLFRAWLGEHFGDEPAVARDPLVALTRDEVYTHVFEDDAAVVRYAELPISDPHKQVVAALLVDRAQDFCFECRAGTLLVGVVAGDRIFVVDAPTRDTIDIPVACHGPAADTTSERPGDADTTSPDRRMRMEDQSFGDFRQCYGAAMPSDPRYPRIVAQARALVEALPDR